VCPVVAQDCGVVKPVVYSLLGQAAGIMVEIDRADEGDIHDFSIKGRDGN
jgi:hypothetical protein